MAALAHGDKRLRQILAGGLVDVDLDQPVADHEARGRGPEVGAQASGPALELVQRLREPPVPGLRELLAVAVPGGEDDVLHSLSHEDVLELRLLLDVLLPAPDLHAVERRQYVEKESQFEDILVRERVKDIVLPGPRRTLTEAGTGGSRRR